MTETKKKQETRGLAERYHKEGCPDNRTEVYQRMEPKGLTRYIHCIDCGGLKAEVIGPYVPDWTDEQIWKKRA